MDKAAIIKSTQKFLAKGQVDKAIAEWQKLAKSYPDGNTLNFLGDLFLKKGDKKGAVEEYHKAAKVFTDEGFSLKALAIHKKVLNINPHFAPALIALGKLNEEKNIATDAIKYYLAAADILAKENKKQELLDVFQSITKLAPRNIQLKIKIGEMFSKEGFVPEASAEYYNVGQLYFEKGDAAKAKEFYNKSYEISPNNPDVLMALSRLSEKQGNMDEAYEYLNTAMERLGESSSLLIRSAELAMKKGDMPKASELLAKVVASEPDNIDARKQLGALYEKQGDSAKAWEEYKAIVDSTSSENPDEAIAMLNRFKNAEPIENRKKLVFLYRQSDRTDEALNELVGLADIYLEEGRKEEAMSSLREATDIAPDHIEAASKLAQLKEELEAAAAPAAAPAGEEFGGPGISLQEEEAAPSMGLAEEPAAAPAAPAKEAGEKPLDVALTEADVFLKYGLHNDARTLLEGLKMKHPDSLELHEKLKTVYKETNETELAVTECIVLASLHERQGDSSTAQALYEEAYELNPGDPRLEGKVAAAAAPAAGAGVALSSNEEYSEAEFYFQQGFYKEAGAIYQKLQAEYPDNEELREKMQIVEAKLSGAPAEEPEAVAVEAEETVNPFEDIEIPEFESLSVQPEEEPVLDDNVLEIFDEFKKGLEKEIADEDAETHYNLGIAYMEMGLQDDAIKAFQTSQHDPNYHSQSSTMLGICYMQKGLFKLSIDSFSAALMKASPGDDTYWSLKYDLADAHDKNGDVKLALDLFTEVYGWNANFRDVSDRLNGLKKKAESAPQQPSAGEPKKDRRSRVSYI